MVIFHSYVSLPEGNLTPRDRDTEVEVRWRVGWHRQTAEICEFRRGHGERVTANASQ